LFYKFRYGADVEFVCIDTSKEAFFRRHRLFRLPKHWAFVEAAFANDGPSPRWRIPFAHHPPYCAGPRHHNTKSMARLLPLFRRAGVRAMFSGHEHNFQHSSVDGIDYFVSGGAGHTRLGTPDRFEEARTASWSDRHHFLLVSIVGERMTVRAIGEHAGSGAPLSDIQRLDPGGNTIAGPIDVTIAAR
jgi:hypothetical protein